MVYCAAVAGAYKGESDPEEKPSKKNLIKVRKHIKKAKTLEKKKRKTEPKIVKDSLTQSLEPHFTPEEIAKLSFPKSKALDLEDKFWQFGNNWIQDFMNKKKKPLPAVDDDYSNYVIEKSATTNDQATAFRKRCLEQVTSELEQTTGINDGTLIEQVNLSYLQNSKSKVRLEDIYQILKKKKKK